MFNPKDKGAEEEVEYLEEILKEYGKYVENIGQNGLAATLLLHYRTELQETLEDLEGEIPLEPYWEQTAKLDEKLRQEKENFLAEVGWQAYRTEREALSPPKQYWWWHLDQGLIPPDQQNPIRNWWNWLLNP